MSSLQERLQKQITDISTQIKNLEQKIQDLLKQKEDTKIALEPVLVTPASNWDIIGYRAPPNAQNMTRYREIAVYGYRTPAVYRTDYSYDPQYDTAIDLIKTQIEDLKKQLEDLKNQLESNTQAEIKAQKQIQSIGTGLAIVGGLALLMK